MAVRKDNPEPDNQPRRVKRRIRLRKRRMEREAQAAAEMQADESQSETAKIVSALESMVSERSGRGTAEAGELTEAAGLEMAGDAPEAIAEAPGAGFDIGAEDGTGADIVSESEPHVAVETEPAEDIEPEAEEPAVVVPETETEVAQEVEEISAADVAEDVAEAVQVEEIPVDEDFGTVPDSETTPEETVQVAAAADATEDVSDLPPDLKKKELLEQVMTRSGVRRREARRAVEAMLEVMGEAAAEGRRMSLPPLGQLRITRAEDKEKVRMTVLRLRQRKGGGAEPNDPLAEPGD